MLVKGGDDLNSLRAMMDLMEQHPQESKLMPPPMPPVEDEGGDEIGKDATNDWRDVVGEIKD